MYTKLLSNPRLYSLLLDIDLKRLEEFQNKNCPHCGGHLDLAHFRRKPREVPDFVNDAFNLRFSLCCRNDGCRKRLSPPSLRFFGRRSWIASIFLVASALSGSCSSSQIKEFKNEYALSSRTLKNWRRWWNEVFSTSSKCLELKGFFYPQESDFEFPRSLIEKIAPNFYHCLGDHIQVLKVILSQCI